MVAEIIPNSRQQIYYIEFTEQAEKVLSKLPALVVNKIKNRTAKLSTDPYLGKALSGEYKGTYSLRVWPYRVIYEIIKQRLVVTVIYIGHRQGIYR